MDESIMWTTIIGVAIRGSSGSMLAPSTRILRISERRTKVKHTPLWSSPYPRHNVEHITQCRSHPRHHHNALSCTKGVSGNVRSRCAPSRS